MSIEDRESFATIVISMLDDVLVDALSLLADSANQSNEMFESV